jgi:hypothetical protein
MARTKAMSDKKGRKTNEGDFPYLTRWTERPVLIM